MKKRLIAIVIYTLYWLLFFIAARIIFLVMQFGELTSYGMGTILKTFINGFKLDLSTACYFIVLPLLLTIPDLYFTGRWYKIFLKIYSFILIILSSALVLGDGITYSYWGFRLEFFIMEYLKTPADAAASATNLQIIGFSIALLILSGIAIFICNKLINRLFSSFKRAKFPLIQVVIILLLTGSLIVPLRGGFGVAPLNAGSVYFSSSLFPNHAAINVIWNFGHTAIYRKPSKNPYSFHKPDDARRDLEYLTTDNGPIHKVLNTNRPNVLLLILESFGSSLTEIESTDSIVTPRFRELIKEGIYFTNLYAAGSRTDKAIPAIFSGYPNLPTIQVIREPKKTQSMPGIIKLLDSAGYKTSFWYGGDINFANINSFITTSGFRQKVTKEDFDPSYYNSKWGVHDEAMLNRLFDSLSTAKQPFAYSALTLSSHEPFEVPMDPVFKGKDLLSLFKNSVYYTDKSLGEFIDKAKKKAWWKNTVIIIIADHCRRNSETIPLYSGEIFRIPMLWIGGAVEQKNMKVNKYANQFDLPLTLAGQLNLKTSFPFSKDLLSAGSHSFSFYTYNDGFAFITDSATSIYDAKLRGSVYSRGTNPESAERLGKSFLQTLFDDYLKR